MRYADGGGLDVVGRARREAVRMRAVDLFEQRVPGRPARLYADRGYDHDKYRRLLRERNITPHIARRGTPHGSGLGVHRWYVERTIAWLHAFKPDLAQDCGSWRGSLMLSCGFAG